MKKEAKLFNAITEIDDSFLEEAEEKLAKERKNLFFKVVSIAACICLCIFSGINILDRFDYLGSGCSAWPGDVVEGKYYFSVQHDGIYCYEPEEKTSEKLLSAFWYDDYEITPDGIYYTSKNKLSFLSFETGKKERLYKARGYGHINADLDFDGNITITCYNRLFRTKKVLTLEALTGDVIEVKVPKMSFEEYSKAYEDNIPISFKGKKLILKGDDPFRERFKLLENGKNILPENTFVTGYLWNYYTSPSGNKLFTEAVVCTSDGTFPAIVQLTEDSLKVFNIPQCTDLNFTDEYIFFLKDEAIHLLNLDDGKMRKLEVEGKSNIEFYSFATDGNFIYVTVPWDSVHEVWKIEKDEEGNPYKMTFYDENALK